MRKKIFRSILFTSLAVLIMALSIAVGSLYYYFGEVQENQLHTELDLVVEAVESGGVDYLRGIETGELRLTLVSSDGTVIYDTDAAHETMGNHGNREEIREALETGTGESFRYSDTLTEKTLYYATRLSNGTVLRISVGQATMLALIGGTAPWFILAAALAALLSWVLSRKLTSRIITPLNRVDLDNPLENDTYDELSPLLSKIHHQHQQIDAQMTQLREKKDEFEHITSSMKEGLVLLDAQGKILSINPAAAAFFNVQGDPAGLDLLTVERSREMSRAVADALKTGFASVREERNGRTSQLDVSRIESEGKVLGLVILTFDVSEQEYAERTRREFSANVSHELKTPLTSIIASAEMLESGMVRPEDSLRFIGHIRRESDRLLTLIDDIIRLSQLDEGVEVPPEKVDLAKIAAEEVELLRGTAEEFDVSLELCAEESVLLGTPRLLHEIVHNLVENAVKYNVRGGSVTVSVRRGEGRTILCVSDTGIGIPAEHQDRVFERFYRVDKSHSKQSGGTGLGLSIVKHAAAGFGADISLESEPGKGTTVTVSFPN